jgi:hypothetical protein
MGHPEVDETSRNGQKFQKCMGCNGVSTNDRVSRSIWDIQKWATHPEMDERCMGCMGVYELLFSCWGVKQTRSPKVEETSKSGRHVLKLTRHPEMDELPEVDGVCGVLTCG